jgi:hypothetical protein
MAICESKTKPFASLRVTIPYYPANEVKPLGALGRQGVFGKPLCKNKSKMMFCNKISFAYSFLNQKIKYNLG